MKVALVRCPCIHLPYPPSVGLAYINSALKKAGHEIFIFDLNIEVFHAVDDSSKKKWAGPDVTNLSDLGEEIFHKHSQLFKEYVKRMLGAGVTVIGFSVWDSNVSLSLKIAQEIKQLEPNIKVIFGGPECFPKWSGDSLIKNDCVDVVVYGEAEETLTEVIDYLQLTGRIGLHSGTLVKKNGSIVDCGIREPVHDLDTLPFPDFDGFPLEKYMTKEMPILFNRGCSRKCAYCSLPGTTPRYRCRSAHSIYGELKYQINKYPHIDLFPCHSPALNSNLKELSRLCDFIIHGGLKIHWSGFAVIDKHMDADLLKKMKAAGCSCLNFGIESGSQRIIDKMRKGFRVEDAVSNIRDAHSLGLDIVVNFIVGFPGEDEEDFKRTLDFISRNKEYISSVGSTASCWIGPYIWIYEHPEEFAIAKGYGQHDWSCKENNYQLRQIREHRLRELVDSLGIGNAYPQLLDNQ